MINLFDLSIVIPIFNEEKNLPELYQRITTNAIKISNSYEIIFVDDGSIDTSLQFIKNLTLHDEHVRYLSFSRNFSHQIAITAGLDKSRGKSVIIMDGDLQDPPEVIPVLYKKYKEGYKVVYAKRKIRKGESFIKKISAKIFYRILVNITSCNIPVDTGDFRIIDRLIVEKLKQMPESNKFLRGQIAWLGFEQTFIEFERDPRKNGKPGYSLKKLIQLAMNGITGFSNVPIKFASYAGIITTFIAFLIIVYALYSKIFQNNIISGWTSLIISTMFIGGIQLITIGIIGEYICHINNDVRKRPLYIISETNIEE